MAKPGATGVTRIINATGYSMKGLKSAWINEAAFRQELMLILLLMPLAFWLGGFSQPDPAAYRHQLAGGDRRDPQLRH